MAAGEDFVIDAVVHDNDSRQENCKSAFAKDFFESLFRAHQRNLPPEYHLDRARYFQLTPAEALASAIFVETPTDVAVYHTIAAWGIFHDLCPISVAMEIRQRYPGRMLVYGAASPLEGKKAIEDLEQQVAEWDLIGLKLYPIDIIDGELRSYKLSDQKLVYPLLQRCVDLGVRVVAIHKAVPVGPAPMDPFRPDDVDYAAIDFPQLTFEIVHGGFAFLEESARQIARFPNVYINLESTGMLAIKRPRMFAKILGELLRWGGPTKLFWGTGCNATGHSAPVLQAFKDFVMPKDLIENYGMPEVTPEIKANILAKNYAAVHRLDIEKLRAQIKGDELERRRHEPGATRPWSKLTAAAEPVPILR